MKKNVTCKNCGWVHFEMRRVDAEASVKEFNDFYDTLSPDKQQSYYGGKKSSIDGYTKCFFCGGPYTNFRDSEPGDCPDGCTIQAILCRDD